VLVLREDVSRLRGLRGEGIAVWFPTVGRGRYR
jgi:hypothetical protein